MSSFVYPTLPLQTTPQWILLDHLIPRRSNIAPSCHFQTTKRRHSHLSVSSKVPNHTKRPSQYVRRSNDPKEPDSRLNQRDGRSVQPALSPAGRNVRHGSSRLLLAEGLDVGRGHGLLIAVGQGYQAEGWIGR